jgi:predicted PurR-regulated permease PerM
MTHMPRRCAMSAQAVRRLQGPSLMRASGQFDGQEVRESGTSRVVQLIALTAVVALTVYLCWKLLAPFIYPFTWALALAIACAPLRRRLLARMSRLPAALLILVLVIVVIGVPLTFLLRQLLQELLRAEVFISNSMQANNWRGALAGNRWLGPLWIWANQQFDLGQIAQQMAAGAAGWIAPAVTRSVRILSQTGVALLALFFFLRDGERLVAALGRLLPLSPAESSHVFSRISLTLRTAVYGRAFIGLIQGSLGGVIFAIVGLPAAIFWGAIMSVLSMLPFLGSFVVWIPAVAYLLLIGRWIAALVVTVWGIAVINPVDNILYPVLVGARVGMHPLVLFVAFVGGLIAFGPTGLILGPCIIAFAVGLTEVWQQRRAALQEGES